MKKILIPIDFAESSARAIRYAEDVFKGQEAELHLIHVVPAATPGMEEVTKAFARFESEHLSQTEIPYTFLVKKGVVLLEIQHAIDELKPTVVIIGLDGGSLSKAYLRLADCPVILIPKNSSQIKIKNIAYANDFLNIRDSSAFGPLLDLSRTFGADIHIIHVNKDNDTSLPLDKSEAAIEYYLNPVKHEYFSVNSNDIVGAIQKYVADKDIDLLTLLLRDHGTNELHSKGELVDQLVSKSNVPILSLV
ncbi:MAG TPA: universal stress protein [Cyclobacteriaceae bacterium]|nr:universal stress protein [Cyclobacteriaceae bacterium]